MSDVDIRGLCPPQFAPVWDAFEANFRDGEELGARFSLVVDGELVVDILGGHADRARTRPFDIDTLCPVFSSTKAVAAILIARLVDRGKLDYRQTVASVWPEFAQAGKGEITVEQALSHQGGLSGLIHEVDPALWYDWDAACAAIAAQPPLWPPGTASGYHPVTYGYIAGEIFRRVDGRTMGRALKDDLAGPLNLDVWIGLPEAEHPRAAEMLKPSSLPKFGQSNDALKAAFLTKWASPGGPTALWRTVEIPSANGHATAEGLARLMAAFIGGEIVSPQTMRLASAERIFGRDLVLPYDISWGAGLMRNVPNMIYGPGEATFGHSGRGGSCVFGDPERQVAGAYVMNKESAWLIGDPRARRLVNAAYEALG